MIRIYDLERKKAQALRQEQRSAAGGTGDRSDKIRTYNFPQVLIRETQSFHFLSFTFC